MKIVWSRKALGDLAAIRAYIARDNPGAARRVASHLVEAIETTLPSAPHIGRPGRVFGAREFVVVGTPFIIPYRAQNEAIQILRIYHGARRWPDVL
ncbi:type II toxin-antitoxin system RelE/ParE family toxin [Methylosinus sp. H3A]|uniref:type II toxin-antitoxin system RelE/ParE family toxin n=1 Tax=Methylosinus sp. H3A TaxID=2785786 RepID=UPI0018C34FB3|nr:type II toxin-antitoxin system RelE/ParE family toxin [Methylosinus sp. H3A]MBG0812024.1 type II toxin-antitoxin system RelE/ParE family toxin [Methylosinus sp. H3A]